MRSCVKTGCRWPAAATLSYRYATAEVWLTDLGEDHPSTHDLCPHHADDLRVPRGWTLVDDRHPAEAVHEPSAAELVERVTKLRSNVQTMLDQPAAPRSGRSRYADLLQDLPTYARPQPEDTDADDDPDATQGPNATQAQDDGLVNAGAVMPVHDLTVGRRAVPAPHPHDDQDGRPTRPDPQAVHATGLRGAIVVQLPLRTEGDPDA